MRLIINAHQTEISSAEEKYLRKKLSKLSKFLDKNTKLEVYIKDIRGGDKEGIDKQVGIVTKSFGKVVRISQTSSSVNKAIDELQEKAIRVLRKRKEKRIDKQRRSKSFLKRLLPTNWFNRGE